ncbi:MAG: hypothetical protein IT365_29225 [Candidatus Hydrogenedentes bacterium]|nr:hypothetical protein [Candidatus Hydrogenedentota bacterium]
MAVSKSSLKKRGKVFYLRFSENATRKRISLHTNSRETAKELQRQFDSARARGEGNVFPTKTMLASAVTAYIADMVVVPNDVCRMIPVITEQHPMKKTKVILSKGSILTKH